MCVLFVVIAAGCVLLLFIIRQLTKYFLQGVGLRLCVTDELNKINLDIVSVGVSARKYSDRPKQQ